MTTGRREGVFQVPAPPHPNRSPLTIKKLRVSLKWTLRFIKNVKRSCALVYLQQQSKGDTVSFTCVTRTSQLYGQWNFLSCYRVLWPCERVYECLSLFTMISATELSLPLCMPRYCIFRVPVQTSTYTVFHTCAGPF